MDPITTLENELLDTYRRRTPRSKDLFERAVRVMPGGDTRTGTFHLPYPLFVERGQGCKIWDADGNEYLDFLNNFTSLIHGHAHPGVHEALVTQGTQGTVHGTANTMQVRLAEILCERVPSVERLRFCNSGSEATMFALRAAKEFAGKSRVMKMEGGYHGSHDQVAVAMTSPFDLTPVAGLSPGALSEVVLGRFNDLEYTAGLIRQHKDELAAVIVEPVMGAAGAIPADESFLAGLRQVTRECGVLLVLDEIITFRLGYGGLQGQYDVRPDLTCFGKIIGGGLPIGAFGGRADVMATYDPTRPGGIIHSGTYNGNAATMAAGIRTLELYDRRAVGELNRLGEALRARLNRMGERAGIDLIVTGAGSFMQAHVQKPPLKNPRHAGGDKRLLRLLHLGLLTSGVFVSARQMYVLSTAMSESVAQEFDRRFEAALQRIGAALREAKPASVST